MKEVLFCSMAAMPDCTRSSVCVDARSRLIEDEDARIGEHGACKRQKLSLPDGELRTALADLGVIAVFHLHDKAVCVDCFRCGDHFRLRRVAFAVADIFPALFR